MALQKILTLEVVDRLEGKTFWLEKNPYTGQWRHPVRKIDVCGATTSTTVEESPTGARYSVCLQKAGSGTGTPGAGACIRHLARGMHRELAKGRAADLLRDIGARQALESMGIPIEIHPADALMHLVYEAAGNVAFLGGRVAELGLSLVGDVYSLTREGDAVATSEDARAIVKLYNDERDRLAKVAKLAIDAGLEERQVRVLEDQAVMIGTVLRRVILSLGLEEAVATRALSSLAGEFKRLEAGGETPGVDAKKR